MVIDRYLVLALFFLILPLRLFSQEVTITAEVEQKVPAGVPIKGTITVTHDQNAAVDASSFKLGNTPLQADFIKDVKISPRSPLVVSIYKFSMEPHTTGLHVLPEVTVNVGGKTYRSIQSTFEVEGSGASPPQPARKSSGTSSIVLGLDNIVEGDTTLYPKQRIKVGYRFSFNYSMDLTKEQLPFLVANGFRKIGERESKDYSTGNLNYVDVTQVIEAVEPGDFQFAPGVIEGRAYRPGPLGQKDYARSVSHAESKPLTISVIPFPEKGKPPSFNGAIGESLDIEMSLLSSGEIAVGDKVVLQIKIFGTGELESLPMPEICCQPGYSGFFRLSDLPPIEEVVGNIKTFKVETRPLTAAVKEIPILEFSYFNPRDKTYTTLHTKPIPLKVVPLKTKVEVEKIPGLPAGEQEMQEEIVAPEPIEIEGNLPLDYADLKNLPFSSWWMLLILPLGVGALFLQISMRRYMEKQKQIVKPETSGDLFKTALSNDPGSPEYCNGIRRAFLLKLVENGYISNVNAPVESFPETEATKKVKDLLLEIEEKRFSGKEYPFDAQFVGKIKQLFRDI